MVKDYRFTFPRGEPFKWDPSQRLGLPPNVDDDIGYLQCIAIHEIESNYPDLMPHTKSKIDCIWDQLTAWNYWLDVESGLAPDHLPRSLRKYAENFRYSFP